MAEATIKAFRVTVKDLETGKILTDEITPLAIVTVLQNANENQDSFASGVFIKRGVSTKNLLNSCKALDEVKGRILHKIAGEIGKKLGLEPLAEEDEE